MYWQAGSLPEDAGEMERRGVDGAGDVVERDTFGQPAGQVAFRSFGTVHVIVLCAAPPAPPRQTVPGERRFQSIGHELKRRHINQEWIGLGGFQPLYEFVVPAEYDGTAGAGDERKWPFGTVVDGGIELADDVAEHARRGDENGAAIAAVGRMADAIGRSF